MSNRLNPCATVRGINVEERASERTNEREEERMSEKKKSVIEKEVPQSDRPRTRATLPLVHVILTQHRDAYRCSAAWLPAEYE